MTTEQVIIMIFYSIMSYWWFSWKENFRMSIFTKYGKQLFLSNLLGWSIIYWWWGKNQKFVLEFILKTYYIFFKLLNWQSFLNLELSTWIQNFNKGSFCSKFHSQQKYWGIFFQILQSSGALSGPTFQWFSKWQYYGVNFRSLRVFSGLLRSEKGILGVLVSKSILTFLLNTETRLLLITRLNNIKGCGIQSSLFKRFFIFSVMLVLDLRLKLSMLTKLVVWLSVQRQVPNMVSKLV